MTAGGCAAPSGAMRKRLLRSEDGIALVMALGITVVLIIFVASMIAYTTLELARGATLSSADLMATQYAEAGLNAAYSMIVSQNTTSRRQSDRREPARLQRRRRRGRHDRPVELHEPDRRRSSA